MEKAVKYLTPQQQLLKATSNDSLDDKQRDKIISDALEMSCSNVINEVRESLNSNKDSNDDETP